MVNEIRFTEAVSATLKDILADFLAARRAEVMSTSIFEYDREAHLRQAAKSDSMEEFIRGM